MNRRNIPLAFVALSLIAAVAALNANQQGRENANNMLTQYVHFQQGNGPSAWGILEGETIQRLSAAPFSGGTRSGPSVPLSAVTLLPPAIPRTSVITTVNYPSGLNENQQPRQNPTIITLPPNAFVGQGAPIRRHAELKDLRAEATVAVIIGRRATAVTPEQARQAIFGVAPAVDVTAMDWRSGQWTRAKGADSYKPIGPAVVTGVDYNNLTIIGKHNGTALPAVKTAEMLADFTELISHISQSKTLNPGDIVLAGTAGPKFTVALNVGDTFEVEIAGVGTLRNKVEARPAMTTLPPPFKRQ